MADTGDNGPRATDDKGLNESPDERQPLIHPRQPQTVGLDSFRLRREGQETDKCTRIVLAVLKAVFCSLGLWGHQAWNYIPRVLLGAVCIYEGVVALYINLLHDCFHTNYKNLTDEKKQPFRYGNKVGDMDIFIISMAAVISYFIFVCCFMAAKRKDSAFVSPSQSLPNHVSKGETIVLFLAFIVVTLLLLSSSMGVFYKRRRENSGEIHQAENSFCTLLAATGVAAQFLLRFVSVNTCHVFAVSSFTLGKCYVFFHSLFLVMELWPSQVTMLLLLIEMNVVLYEL